MANPEHLAKLKEGVEAWNRWREQKPNFEIDLSEADLREVDLDKADLSYANLSKANLESKYVSHARLFAADLTYADLKSATLDGGYLFRARLDHANLEGTRFGNANLSHATFEKANMYYCQLDSANLTSSYLGDANLVRAWLSGADLNGARLDGANLSLAELSDSDLRDATFTFANLNGADLSYANLTNAEFRGADLREAKLIGSILIETDLSEADLSGSFVYGISAWNVQLHEAIQSNLVITRWDESAIQVDSLDVAQFIYLLLNNERIRHVIDTVTSKVVLILGRFTPERKEILEAIRGELRRGGFLPILFDFQKPDSKDLTGTISTLANMARFIIADLTDPSSVPHELATLAPGTVVPIQTILLDSQREYTMFPDLIRRHHWVLEPYHYESPQTLIAHLGDSVIAPAEAKAMELRRPLS
jgi:uncharacterized protein YjbI with pentapeptide repeats